MHITIVIASCLALLAAVACGHTIKHVVVLMEENRSFDHLLGYRPGVDGLKGTESNWIDPKDHAKGKLTVSDKAKNVNICSPNHDAPDTTRKVFGLAQADAGNFTRPDMSGFAPDEALWGGGK